MKKAIIFALLIIALGFLISLGIYLSSRKPSPAPSPEKAPQEAMEKKNQEEGVPKEEVVLFFPTMEGYLLKETREIEKLDAPEMKAMALLSQLKNPPSGAFSPFPPGGDIRRVFLLGKEAVVDLDLPSEGYGTQYELLTIYSIVDSLTYNMDVEKVKLVLGGMERKTLFGHISLKYAFFQDLSYAGK